MPDAPGLELIAQELGEVREGSVLGTSHERDIATLIVDPEAILDVLGWLRDTPAQSYTFLASLHAADYLPAKPRFAVHYELLSMERVERLHVKALLKEPTKVPTSSRRDPACPHGHRGHASAPTNRLMR